MLLTHSDLVGVRLLQIQITKLRQPQYIALFSKALDNIDILIQTFLPWVVESFSDKTMVIDTMSDSTHKAENY